MDAETPAAAQIGGYRVQATEQHQSRIMTILHEGKQLPDIRGA